MRVKYLDKGLKSFMNCSLVLIALIGAAVLLFSYIYSSFTIDIYNKIIYTLIFISVIAIAVLIVSIMALFAAIKRRKIEKVLIIPIKICLKLVMPLALFISGVLGRDKDAIRSLFIDVNNLLVESSGIRKAPDKILLLLPHCLQYSECTQKVTGNITNCKKCGKCKIAEILNLAEETGVNALIVTGGTAARNAIKKIKPEMVLSVACERDLAIGISDVSNIPVLGVLNQRPNGPCFNTTVDIELLRDKLKSIIKQ
jgi:hypothetical protein